MGPGRFGRGAGTALLLVAVVAGGCQDTPKPSPIASNTTPTAAVSSNASPGAEPTAAATTGDVPSAAPAADPVPEELLDRTWMAEGPNGWVVGALNGRSLTLPPEEVALAVDGNWILSVDLKDPGAAKLLIRRFDAPDPVTVDIGDRSPGSVAIAGDRAFIGGLLTDSDTDPGVLAIDLRDPSPHLLFDPTTDPGGRYVATSRDRRILVTTLCPQEDAYLGACSADVFDAAKGGRIGHLDKIEGGVLRAVDARFLVVTPQGDAAPDQVFALAAEGGKPLLEQTGREFTSGYLATDGTFVQAMLDTSGDSPVFVIETVNLAEGKINPIFKGPADDTLPGLWAELSDDRLVVVGPWSTVEVALGRNDFKPVVAQVIDLATGAVVANILVGPQG